MATLQAVLQLIKRVAPATGVVENVQGMRVTDPGCDASPLQYALSELQGMGYATTDIDVDLRTWHGVVRRRLSTLVTSDRPTKPSDGDGGLLTKGAKPILLESAE